MQAKRFRDLPANGHDRIERGHRVLEDHGDLPTPDHPHFRVRDPEQIPPAKIDLSVGDFTRRAGDQAHDGEGVDALPTAAFANNTDRLSLVKGVGDAVHCKDGSIIGVETRLQIADFQKPGIQFAITLGHERTSIEADNNRWAEHHSS